MPVVQLLLLLLGELELWVELVKQEDPGVQIRDLPV